MFIDSHTHLYSSQFDEDRDAAIQRAMEAGVKRFLLPAIDSKSHPAMLQLEAAYPKNMHAMMGLHPVDVQPESYREELQMVKDYLDSRKFVAIGEIGIDLYWDASTLAIQQEAFSQQIGWAKDLDLPIVIHSREAFAETFEVLESQKSPKLRGVFHCFTGNLAQAKQALDLNFALGIGGVATFKNGGLDKILPEIPLEKIVLETDSPYLAPAPHRGKRNESAYLPLVAQKLAEIYQTDVETVARITTANCEQIFGLENLADG